MAVILEPSTGDFLFQSDFVELPFGLFRDPVALQAQLFKELSRYGLRPADVRFDSGSGVLGDAVYSYHFPSLHLTLRLRIERVELFCNDLSKADIETIKDLGVGVLKLMQQNEIGFKTHALTMTLHAALRNMSAKDFISRFVLPGPENLGPRLGNAVVYYYGPRGKLQGAAVTFDPSVRVKDGLFVRIQGTWDGAQTSIPDIPTLAEEHVRDMLKSFDLEPPQQVSA